MDPDEITGAVVAALAAMHRGDDEGAQLALDHVDHEAALGVAMGMLARLGPAAAGSPDGWGETLAAWTPWPGRRLGDAS